MSMQNAGSIPRFMRPVSSAIPSAGWPFNRDLFGGCALDRPPDGQLVARQRAFELLAHVDGKSGKLLKSKHSS
jgi:hypothetical protein